MQVGIVKHAVLFAGMHVCVHTHVCVCIKCSGWIQMRLPKCLSVSNFCTLQNFVH